VPAPAPAPAPARAPAPAPSTIQVPVDAAHSPGFVTMDRMDGTSRAGGEVSYMFPDHNGSNDVTAMRFEGHVQYVSPSGLGFYAQVPLAYVSEGNQSDTPLGDLEVGGVFVPPQLVKPNGAVVLRLGVTLPTGGNSAIDAATSDIVSATRINDVYDLLPEGVSIRAGMSYLYRSGNVFGRIDGGLDVNHSVTGNASVHSVMRLNAGLGVDLGKVAIMGELVNLDDLGSNNAALSGPKWINTAAVSMRIFSGGVQPYVAAVIPLDDDANKYMTAALTLGIDGLIGRHGAR
jgi:hypothetical protein